LKIAFYSYSPQMVVSMLPIYFECKKRGHEVKYYACSKQKALFGFELGDEYKQHLLTNTCGFLVENNIEPIEIELEAPEFPDGYDYACINYEGVYLNAMLKEAHSKGGRVVWTLHGISQMKGSDCENTKADLILANAPDVWWTCFKWEHPEHTHTNPPEHKGLRIVGYCPSDYLVNFRQENLNTSEPVILYASTHLHHASNISSALKAIAEIKKKNYNWKFVVKEHGGEPYDINPLLVCADILISDCSSVIWEYLVLNRPIVLLNEFDIPELKKSQPNIGFRMAASQIESSIKAYLVNPKLFEAERTEECNRVHYKLDGEAAIRAVNALEMEL